MTVKSTADSDATRRPATQAGERAAVSYLVRFWLEPQVEEDESPLYRGYARDLRTGEERYFGDPRRLAEHILRRLQTTRREQAGRSQPEHAEEATG